MASVETLVRTLLNNPIAYWPLVAKYDSGLSNVGADYGPDRWHSIADADLSAVSGPFAGERVIKGNGSSSFIHLPNTLADALYAQSTAIWVMGWHKHPTGAGANRVLFYMPNAADDTGIEVGINPSNQLYASIRSYAGDSLATGTSSPDTISNDTWQFFCVRFRISIDQIIITLGSGSHRVNNVTMVSNSTDFGSGGAPNSQTSLLCRTEAASPPADLYADGGLAHVVLCTADTSNSIVTAFAAADAGLDAGGPVTGANTATLSVTLRDRWGAPRPNLTGLQWAFFDEPNPVDFAYPAGQGTGETTDASGVLSITSPTALSVGTQTGFLLVSNTSGVAGEQSLAFAQPVDVDVV